MNEHAMITLAALAEATAFEIWDDDRMLVVTPRGNWEPTGEDIDLLLERGWIDGEGDRVFVTERGRYWLDRWQKKRAAGRAASFYEV